jgi:hypothetical protein
VTFLTLDLSTPLMSPSRLVPDGGGGTAAGAPLDPLEPLDELAGILSGECASLGSL